MRILLGIVFLYDLSVRWGHLEVFYTDYGVLSRKIFIDSLEIPWKMSLLVLNGTLGFAEIFIGIGVIAGLMFVFGVRTKLSGFLCWITLMSFQSRNPLIVHGGDNLLRMLFFWGMMLPLHARYSFDRASAKEDLPADSSIANVFSMSLILQVCFIYIFTTVYKMNSTWMTSFTSIYYALSLDMFTTTFGDWLAQFHTLTVIMTAVTMFIEAFGIFFLFSPFKNQRTRMFAIVLFAGLHVGIWLCFRLGTFAPACLIAWLALLPPIFWDRIEKYFTPNKNIQIFYDLDCGFCLKMVNLIKMFLHLPNVKPEPAQNNKTIFKDMQQKNSWVVLIDDKKYFEFDAIAELIKSSKLLFIFFPILILKPVGNYLYKTIARRRKQMSAILNTIGYSKIKLDGGVIQKSFAIFIIGLVFAWNLEGTNAIPGFDIRGNYNDLVFALQLNQQWNMFAPSPMTGDGWFVVDGQLFDGSSYDILNDRRYTELRPKKLDTQYKDVHWEKFLLNLKFSPENYKIIYFARYLCRSWNDTHPEEKWVRTFKINYMMELTPPMGEPVPEPKKITLWEHNCFK